MTRAQTLLVALDFGETSDEVLEEAVDLARALGAGLVIVHAYQVLAYGYPVAVTEDMLTIAHDAATERLDAAVEHARRAGVRARTLLAEGEPKRVIVETADAAEADLVVLGTHGKRGVARALLGSVAENVIRTSKRPVFVFPVGREQRPARVSSPPSSAVAKS